MRFRRALVACAAFSWLALPLEAQRPSDWRQWRGSARGGAGEAVAAPATRAARLSARGRVPKPTPAFANGRLYAIGMTGVVTAFDAATGKQIWQKPGSSVVPTF